MQATGESLTIGANFETAFMKGVRSVTDNHLPRLENVTDGELDSLIEQSDDRRIFAICEALYRGASVDEINKATSIDKWFLEKLKNIADTEKLLEADKSENAYNAAKNMGFTDFAIEKITGEKVNFSLTPAYDSIDGTAFYSVYGGENAASVKDKKKVLVIGGGPTVAGRSGDNDYCTVHAVNALKNAGCAVVMLNNNPASVTTDYNICDRLYIDPLCDEDVLNVVRSEKPDCALLLFGGEEAVKKSDMLKKEAWKSSVRILSF